MKIFALIKFVRAERAEEYCQRRLNQLGLNNLRAVFFGKRRQNFFLVAATTNAQRFGLSTPCSKTGACMNCKSPDTICCQFLITRFSRHPGRIHVILVNDNLGY